MTVQPHPVDALIGLADEHRHVRGERRREGPDGRWERVHGARLERIAGAFEDMLERWVPSTETRQSWREYLAGARSEPPEVAPQRPPPLYRGRSDDDAVLEIAPADDGMVEWWVDGGMLLREAVWSQDVPVQLGPITWYEEATAPAAAVKALASFVDNGGPPPWSWARALYEDGLIDQTGAPTARGRRILEAIGPVPTPA